MKKIYKPLGRLVMPCCLLIISAIAHAGTIFVINTNNSGPGSLSGAITAANTVPGTDTILFLLPEGGSMTINLTSPTPTITESLYINGYSQPGSVPGPISLRTIRVSVNGTSMGPTGNIFAIEANNVTIAGLALYRATESGIRVGSLASSVHIWGNYLGTDSTGLTAGLGNGQDGVTVNEGSALTVNNVVVGINGDGVLDFAEGNLICSNGRHGVFFWTTQNSKISGNFIGYNKDTVNVAFGNIRNGILNTFNSNNNFIGTNGDGVMDILEGNFIGNNGEQGIFIAAPSSDNNAISGNVIGLGASGVAAGNGFNGIEIRNSSNNRVGTNGDGISDSVEINIICSNVGNGIYINAEDFFGFNSNATGNVIAGNAIGTDPTGTLVRGNDLFGIFIAALSDLSALNNRIGSNNDGISDGVEINGVAYNAKGIVTNTPTGASVLAGNKISRNSVFSNLGMGIDIGDDGITANDNGDPDTGPNELFNFPFLTKSLIEGGNLTIAGISRPGALLEFYIADPAGSGSGFLFRAQEGGTYNGITDDSTGTDSYSDATFGSGTDNKFGFSVPLSSLVTAIVQGAPVTSTATKAALTDSSSSEFGPAILTILPVRWVQFTGRYDNGVVNLNWSTSQEINNSHFDVERSADGSNYSKIGSVAAKGGSTINHYNFTDGKPLAATNFYRLRQIDLDGKSELSRVILIRADLDKIVAKVAPNPFAGSVNLTFKLDRDETINVRLYDQMGRAVKQYRFNSKKGINTINLGDMSNLPAGNYTVELKGGQLNFRQQVVKQ